MMGGDVAASGDLGYVYGKATVRGSSGQTVTAEIHSYLRIWRKQEGGWKIVLDLLSD